MIKTLFLIILSFFAVLGFIECFVTALETYSVSKYKPRKITIVAELDDRIKDVCFLMNTLLLQAERIRYKDVQTQVVIKDCGIDENTYEEIYAFCLENNNITVEK